MDGMRDEISCLESPCRVAMEQVQLKQVCYCRPETESFVGRVDCLTTLGCSHLCFFFLLHFFCCDSDSGGASSVGVKKKKSGSKAASQEDAPKNDFLVRLLAALPQHLQRPLPAHSLTDKHPVVRLLLASLEFQPTDSSAHPKPSAYDADADPSVYWLVLATHVLQQLMPLTKPSPLSEPSDAETAAWLAYHVATALPAKLDAAAGTRQVVGRALLVASTAAAQALAMLTEASSGEDDASQFSNNRAATTACVVALDRVVVLAGSSTTTQHQTVEDAYWASLQWKDLSSVPVSQSAAAAAAVESGTDEVDTGDDERDWSAAEECWRALLLLTAAKDTNEDDDNNDDRMEDDCNNNSTAVVDAFRTLLRDQNTTFSEGRLALKRWSAVALTWYQGQEQILRAALRLLERSTITSGDDNDGACTAVVTLTTPKAPPAAAPDGSKTSGSSASTSKAEGGGGKKKKKAASTKKDKATTSKKEPPPQRSTAVPNNVAQLALVGRLCRIVSEIGSAAGSRPPSGVLDSYLKSVTGVTVKKGHKLVRTDLRDLAMMLSYQFIQRHQDCLRENCYSGGKNEQQQQQSTASLVVNDSAADERRQGKVVGTTEQDASSSSSSSSLPALYHYYPFVHKAIEELASAAFNNMPAGAGGGSLTPQLLFTTRDRIEFAAAAYVLEAQTAAAAAAGPLDARLTHFAVSKLVSCLNTTNNTNTGGGSNAPTADSVLSMPPAASATASTRRKESSSAKPQQQPANPLRRPLPVPSLPAKKSTASRKRKASGAASAAANSNWCSFAGVYDAKSSSINDGAGGDSWTADEKLSLFLRSVEGGDASALVSHLLWIAETTYDTRNTEEQPGSDDRTEGKKRKATTATTRGSKRRKKAGGSRKKTTEDETAAAADDPSERPYK